MPAQARGLTARPRRRAPQEYHQDYVRRNPEQGYVQAVSLPKLCKVQKKFPELLREDAHIVPDSFASGGGRGGECSIV